MRKATAAALTTCSLFLVASSFAASGPRLLTVTVSGHGGVYSSVTKLLACKGSCRVNYRSNRATLVLTALPDAGWQFAHWVGGCVGTRPTCKVSVGAHAHVSAVFVVSPPPTTTTPTTVPAGNVVNVTAGKPSEFSYSLSTQSVSQGVVTFRITNAGLIPHDFEICAVPGDGTATSCVGSATRIIDGQGAMMVPDAATLTVTFTAPGTYEYLCTIPGHAAAGMTGLLTVT